MQHIEYDSWTTFSQNRQFGMLEIIDLICNGHRLLQHWFAMTTQVRDHVENAELPTKAERDKMRNYPFFLSGISMRLSLHMQELNNKRKVMLYILSKCGECKYRRYGDQLYQQRIIPKHTLVLDSEFNEVVCDKCGKPKRAHVFKTVRGRGHVFKPAVDIDDTVMHGTFAWEKLTDKPSKISEFVRWCVARHRAPAMWFDSLSERDHIAHELERTVDDIDLPVLDRSFKHHGLCLSWQNGVYFVYKNEFKTYEEINTSEYPNLTAHYIDAWFHDKQHSIGLRGPYDPSKIDFPKRFRYKNMRKHEVCRNCGKESHYHDNSMCDGQDFELRCVNCDGVKRDCGCRDKHGEPLFACYDVDVVKGLRGIATPFIDGILDKQLRHKPDYEDVYFWIFVMLGRYLFPLDNEKYDDWQKLFCLFGACGVSIRTATLLSSSTFAQTYALRVFNCVHCYW